MNSSEEFTGVDLGFFEPDYETWELESRHFPAKIGGKPAWLNLKHLPQPSQLECQYCAKPSSFLLQVYCPDDEATHAFHRTLFVFICTNSSCWTEGKAAPILVFRSQLPRQNSFYPMEAPMDGAGWRPDIHASAHTTLCPVCGCLATKLCGRCRGVSYCSEAHQRLDWKGGHKALCREGYKWDGRSVVPSASKVLLPEGIIEREAEPAEDGREPDEEVPDYSHLISNEGGEMSAEDLDKFTAAESDTQDPAMDKFRERVRRAPDQVMRYERRGKPLLCNKQQMKNPPNCSRCGSVRTFEMQIMPQILSELKLGMDLVDAGLDWGSIYVFTCDRSCAVEEYVREETVVVNFLKTNIPGA